jgi:hypothetical protein
MHLRAPSPEVQHRDSAYRLRPADRARERHSRDSERSPNVEIGAASVGRLQALTDAKRDAEFEAEISLFEDHNADIPEAILSAQITQLFRWRNQAVTLRIPVPTILSAMAIFHQPVCRFRGQEGNSGYNETSMHSATKLGCNDPCPYGERQKYKK